MTAVAETTRNTTGATHADIQEARALRAQAEQEIQETVTFRSRVLEPMWGRLTARAVHNSFGEEYDLSMTPRGSRP